MALQVNLQKSPFGIAFPEALAQIDSVQVAAGRLKFRVNVFATAQAATDGSQPVFVQEFDFPYEASSVITEAFLYQRLQEIRLSEAQVEVDFTQGIDLAAE